MARHVGVVVVAVVLDQTGDFEMEEAVIVVLIDVFGRKVNP